MKVLLDTNVLLRLAISPTKLSGQLHQGILDADQLFISAISRAEICIKVSVGKLHLPVAEPKFWSMAAARLQADQLAFTPAHAALLVDLPFHHRDPFDRMIVAQCLAENLTLATTDQTLHSYGVQVL